MRRVSGGGQFILALFLVLAGVVMRWDLIDWIIDTVGIILIIAGVVIAIVGLINLFTGGGKKQTSDF